MDEARVYLENVALYADLGEFARHYQDLRWEKVEELERISNGIPDCFLWRTLNPERTLAANFLLQYRDKINEMYDY
jgi:hypothetical protein